MSLCCRNISSVHTKRTFLRWTPAECLDLWQHGYFPSWHLKSILEIMSFSVTCPDWQLEGIVKVNAVIAQVSWALLACHGDFHPDGVSRDTPWIQSKRTSHFMPCIRGCFRYWSSADTPLHRRSDTSEKEINTQLDASLDFACYLINCPSSD